MNQPYFFHLKNQHQPSAELSLFFFFMKRKK